MPPTTISTNSPSQSLEFSTESVPSVTSVVEFSASMEPTSTPGSNETQPPRVTYVTATMSSNSVATQALLYTIVAFIALGATVAVCYTVTHRKPLERPDRDMVGYPANSDAELAWGPARLSRDVGPVDPMFHAFPKPPARQYEVIGPQENYSQPSHDHDYEYDVHCRLPGQTIPENTTIDADYEEITDVDHNRTPAELSTTLESRNVRFQPPIPRSIGSAAPDEPDYLRPTPLKLPSSRNRADIPKDMPAGVKQNQRRYANASELLPQDPLYETMASSISKPSVSDYDSATLPRCMRKITSI